MKFVLRGVDKHLHSPVDRVRTLGMVVGENLMNELNKLDVSDSNEENRPLKFEVSVTFATLSKRSKVLNEKTTT